VSLLAARAEAAEVAIPSAARQVEVHGFVSPGAILTTKNNWLARSKKGSFEFTEVGLNFTVPLTERLRTGVQLFARDLGPFDNYTPRADWFYLDYRFDDWFGLRAGRVKIPFGLYNDSSDIDAARVPVLLPQSLYSVTNRDFLLAQTGAEVYGRVRGPGVGAFEYRIYAGTIFVDPATQSTSRLAVSSIEVPYVVGQRLLWETPLEGLRVGGSLQAIRLDMTSVVAPGTPGVPAGPLAIGVPGVLWVGSAEYVYRDLLLAAEYSRWTVRLDPPLPTVKSRVVSERAYVMGAYHVTSWLAPGLYYSLYFPDVDLRAGREHVQHDIAATLRFDVNAHWIVKAEAHYMGGTALLSERLNGDRPLSTLEPSWGVFLLKTTAHF